MEESAPIAFPCEEDDTMPHEEDAADGHDWIVHNLYGKNSASRMPEDEIRQFV